jgi:GT2 family glycosyltransferase
MLPLDAVVVTYASRHDVGRCLASLRTVRGMETVVVVDHGDDGSDEVAAAMGAVVVRDPDNPGFGAGHNRGVALTRAHYVLLMNPDAVLVPGSVEVGVALLDSEPRVAACQGVIIDEATGMPERSQGVLLGPGHLWGRALRLRGLLRWRPVRSVVRRLPGLADHVARVPDGPVNTAALGATALLVRREAFDAVGGFDRRFFLYGEDMDLSRRWTEAGWRLVALPIRWAVHHAGGSSGSSWGREVEWWRGSMTFAATWYPERAWAMAVGAVMVRAVTLGACRPSRATAAWRAMVVGPRNTRTTRSARPHAELSKTLGPLAPLGPKPIRRTRDEVTCTP